MISIVFIFHKIQRELSSRSNVTDLLKFLPSVTTAFFEEIDPRCCVEHVEEILTSHSNSQQCSVLLGEATVSPPFSGIDLATPKAGQKEFLLLEKCV